MLGVTHDGGTRVPIQQPVPRDGGGAAVFAGPLEKRGAASTQRRYSRDTPAAVALAMTLC